MNDDIDLVWEDLLTDNSNIYYINDNTDRYFSTKISGPTEWENIGVSSSSEIDNLKKEIKDLKKTVARLSTLVCTHIGEEQKAKVNNG